MRRRRKDWTRILDHSAWAKILQETCLGFQDEKEFVYHRVSQPPSLPSEIDNQIFNSLLKRTKPKEISQRQASASNDYIDYEVIKQNFRLKQRPPSPKRHLKPNNRIHRRRNHYKRISARNSSPKPGSQRDTGINFYQVAKYVPPSYQQDTFPDKQLNDYTIYNGKLSPLISLSTPNIPLTSSPKNSNVNTRLNFFQQFHQAPPPNRHLKPREPFPPSLPPRGKCHMPLSSSSSGFSSGVDLVTSDSSSSTPPPLPDSPPPSSDVSKGVILSIESCKENSEPKKDSIENLPEEGKKLMNILHKYVEKEPEQNSSLTKDLRQYLSTRFPKGGIDHDLQNTIRDNVYLRTVPVTTRPPRRNEVNGVDYTFLSDEEFRALQRSGSLLEAGVFEGNHYGTPKPSSQAEPSGRLGQHPSSEGKRRRNRSNVEAMAANCTTNMDETNYNDMDPNQITEELGPLPPNWEKAYTEGGEPYFIDHVAGTSSWLDPRLARVQKRSAAECTEDELPFGWERIDDPQYGTYYIDHVNRKTQYENPVAVARQETEPMSPANDPPMEEFQEPYNDPTPKQEYFDGNIKMPLENGHYSPPKKSHSRGAPFFTRNPSELKGEFLQTTLIKSSRGLGFTIVGGDDNEEEFLQIKSVVPNGPAWQDGKLRTGDVLVYVNDICVLGYTHADVVNMFQNIEANCQVYLEVCRGYPLPFDPNDPNTEIVTTVAVTSSDGRPRIVGKYCDHPCNNSADSMNTAKSMPDLSTTERPVVPRPGSADLLSVENSQSPPNVLEKPEYLTIPIVKGSKGFGFTIADSAYGQKVKKILDRSRCKNLAEGDILVDINNINVKGVNHTEVVQVLKDCPQGLEAIVMIQRGGVSSPMSQRSPRKEKKPGLYRSKTPTAEMYSSQPKEIIPNRPKTPLVDTRNRPKTPNNESYEYENYDENPPSNNYNYQKNPWFDYDRENRQNSRAKYANMNVPEAYLRNESIYPQNNYPPIDNNFVEQNRNFDHERNFVHPDHNYSGHQNNFSYNNYPPTNNYPHNNHFSERNFNEGNSQDQYGYGYYTKDNYDAPQDSGYSSQTQIAPVTKNPYPTYYGHNNSAGFNGSHHRSFDTGDHRKREYTSFELEHPSSISAANAGIPSRPNQSMGAAYNFTVTLRRKESGFGFRIIGGTEEGSQVSIGHIVPGGAADEDGSVLNGDEIIVVDGERVVGSSHHRVVQLMAAAASNGHVTLMLRRHAPPSKFSDLHNESLEIQYPYDVMVTRRENEGFGFVIISSVAKSGSTIGRIIEGSPAERCGKLRIGDRILRVNGVDIKSLHHGSIVNLIKESGYQVRLTIGPPKEEAPSTASNSQRGDSEAGDEEIYRVNLDRGSRGFGFSIRGGREFQNMPLFVLRIAENGPAAQDGKLKVGDQLIEVNGVSTQEMTHADAIELIKQCGSSISLLVRRNSKFNQLDSFPTGSLGSPVGPPPPGTHIRSTATLPSGSPSQLSAFHNVHQYPYYSHNNQNGISRPLHSSPAQYVTNGPLGQSSPRVTMDNNWNRARLDH